MARRGHGEGAIYRRADGRWCGELHIDGGKRKNVYGKTRQEVQRKLAQVRRDVEAGLPVVAERQTVGQFLASWLEMIEPQVRPRTLETYGYLVRVHITPAIGAVKLAKLTPQRVQEFYADRRKCGLSATTVHQMHAVLHRALESAVRLQVIQRNVCDAVDAPAVERLEMRVLTREQAVAFLEASREDRLHALYVLALATGMRQGELLGLHWSDVDLDKGSHQGRLPGAARQSEMAAGPDGTGENGGMLRVRSNLQWVRGEGGKPGAFVFGEPKTRSGVRNIELAAPFVEALREHRKRQVAERLSLGPAWVDNDLVFCTSVGTPLDATNVWRSFFAVLAAAGLPPVRFHDLRHTAASLMRLSGVEVEVISRVLGHSSPSVTMNIYLHVFPQQHRDAAEAMRKALSL